jgi:hypothetical protein
MEQPDEVFGFQLQSIPTDLHLAPRRDQAASKHSDETKCSFAPSHGSFNSRTVAQNRNGRYYARHREKYVTQPLSWLAKNCPLLQA